MFAEGRRIAMDLEPATAQPLRRGDELRLGTPGQRHLPHPAHVLDLRVGEDLRIGVDRGAWHAAAAKPGEEILHVVLRELAFEQLA